MNMKKFFWPVIAAAVLLPAAASAHSVLVFDPRPHPFDPWNHFHMVDEGDLDRAHSSDRYESDRYERDRYERDRYENVDREDYAAPPRDYGPRHRQRRHCWWEDRYTRVCE
jgi:hypothetical protein